MTGRPHFRELSTEDRERFFHQRIRESLFAQLPFGLCFTRAPLLCDDALHILCETCAPDPSGRPRCPACRGKPRPA